jgi:hypothetical protein
MLLADDSFLFVPSLEKGDLSPPHTPHDTFLPLRTLIEEGLKDSFRFHHVQVHQVVEYPPVPSVVDSEGSHSFAFSSWGDTLVFFVGLDEMCEEEKVVDKGVTGGVEGGSYEDGISCVEGDALI